MKPKILIIVPTLASYPFLHELCLTLVENGAQVHLASSGKLNETFQSAQSNIKYHPINFPRGMNPYVHFKAALKLSRLVRRIKPDIIDVHFSAAVFTTALARRKRWPRTIATVQGLRFPVANGFGRRLLKLVECWSANRMDSFAVLTADDLDELRSVGVGTAIQQAGYGFGCDLQKFNINTFSLEDKNAIAGEISKSANDLVMIFIGRLVDFKGFHLVVRSFLDAYQEKNNLKLLVCGEYDKYHPSGLSDAEKFKIEHHPAVKFTGWTKQIQRYLLVSDFVVFPSEREGVPVNLMEALSMGVPVITSDSRGCREVMNRGANGILLKERSTFALTSAIRKMADDSTFREACSRSAIEFRDEFDRMRFVTAHLQRLIVPNPKSE